MMNLVFGADGGGTKTAGVLATQAGEVLARSQAGASNPNVVGVDQSAAVAWELLVACCAQAGCALSEVASATLGLAGAGSPAIRDRVQDAFRKKFHAENIAAPRLSVESDARIALEGAFSGGPGAIVIAGTGSVVLGKSPRGEIFRIGGWGRVLGDEGSGYWIGLEAARAVARHYDGLESPGGLVRKLIERLSWESRETVIVAVYQQEFALASIAPLVLEACEGGDPLARSILSRASDLLLGQLTAAAGRIASEGEVGVVFLGGLIDHETAYARMLAERLATAGTRLRLQKAELPPADGAILMARALAGATLAPTTPKHT